MWKSRQKAEFDSALAADNRLNGGVWSSKIIFFFFSAKKNNAPFPLTSSSFYISPLVTGIQFQLNLMVKTMTTLYFLNEFQLETPVQPSTAQFSPVQPRTVPYRQVQPSVALYSPVQSNTAQ